MNLLPSTIRPYYPLIVVITLSGSMAFIQQVQPSMHQWMKLTMGYFLIILAMLKLFDIPGFKKGFKKYDLITKKYPAYGTIYPILELLLGFLYLGSYFPVLTYVLTILIMGAGGLSVAIAIHKGQKLNCACMGNILSVPLSTVSIIENFGMSAMALYMLITHSF